MCGIVGVFSKDVRGLYAYDRDVFEELLVVNSIRGSDSTGVFGVSMRNEIHIVKQAIDPQTFMKNEAYKNWANKVPQFRAIVGHNRKATSGSIISNNAHPFKEGNIVLVHNGMLFNSKEINKEVDVDSHALCHSFAEKGAKETLQGVYGAFALVWYDIKQQEMYLWRNDDRPLALVEATDKIYIASELKMLDWIIHRDKRNVSVVRDGNIPPNMLYTIKLNPFKMEATALVKQNPTIYEWPHRQVEEEGNEKLASAMAGDIEESPIPQGWLDQAEEESARAVRAAANESIPNVGPTQKSQSQVVRAQYAFDNRVLFCVGDIRPWTEKPDKKYEVKGDIFLPGSPVVPGYIYTNRDTDLKMIKTWKESKKVIGTVEKILGLKDGTMAIHLNNKQITIPETVVTWNKLRLPKFEWELICNDEKCMKCHQMLDIKNPDDTSVLEKQGHLGIYRAVCHVCVGAAVPKSKRAALLKGPIDAVSIQETIQSLSDSLKGNTHGS